MSLTAFCSADAKAPLGYANIRGDFCFPCSALRVNSVRPKKFRTIVIFFKVLTNCWLILHLFMRLYRKKPIARGFLPEQAYVSRKYRKIKVTPDNTAI